MAHRAAAWGIILATGVALVSWWLIADEGSSVSANPAAIGQSANSLNAAGESTFSVNTGAMGGQSPLSPEGIKVREEKRALWRARYERAEQVFNSYRDATRYPHESRPIADAPDQVRPFDPVVEEKIMRNERGEPVKGITLKTSQDRVFLSASDTVKFTVQASDSSGKVLPLLITRAAAQSVADSKLLVQQRSVTLDFSDAGSNSSGAVDDVAGDGQFSASLIPQAQGFGGFGGTIRVLVFVRADGKEGVAHFDVIYTEDTPAVWSGIREAQEAGSLNFYLKVSIRASGRYVVSARVDDARGQPFALLNFNEEVAAGAQEFKLHLFSSPGPPGSPLSLSFV